MYCDGPLVIVVGSNGNTRGSECVHQFKILMFSLEQKSDFIESKVKIDIAKGFPVNVFQAIILKIRIISTKKSI